MKLLVSVDIRARHTVDVNEHDYRVFTDKEAKADDRDAAWERLRTQIDGQLPPIAAGWDDWDVDDEQYDEVKEEGQ